MKRVYKYIMYCMSHQGRSGKDQDQVVQLQNGKPEHDLVTDRKLQHRAPLQEGQLRAGSIYDLQQQHDYILKHEII